MSSSWFRHLAFTPKCSIVVSSDQSTDCLCPGLRLLQVPFGKLIDRVLQRWLSSWKVLLYPQRTAGALTGVTSGFLDTLLSEAPSPLIAQLRRVASSRKLVRNFFRVWRMEATVLIGNFKATAIWLYPSQDLCLQTILSLRSCIVCALTCIDNCDTRGGPQLSCRTPQGGWVETCYILVQFWGWWQNLWTPMYMWFLCFYL